MPTIYRVYPAVVTPLIVAAACAYFGFTLSPWTLVALPFIYLGSVCASPNLNLANGVLVCVAMLLGVAIAIFEREIGMSIFAGASASWILSSIEKALTARPMKDED